MVPGGPLGIYCRVNRLRHHCRAQAIISQSLSWSCAPLSHTCCGHAENSETLVLLMYVCIQ